MPSDKSLIKLEDITIRVRDRFLFAGTCWEILDGQNWAVIGPNGAGKTSLVGAAAGDLPIVGGRVTTADELQEEGKIGHLSFERHRDLIAAEEIRDESRFFSHRLADRLTAGAYLVDACRSYGVREPQMLRLSVLLGIRDLLDRPLQTLSTGEIRMVLIARELLKAPRLMILDEPFAGLDPVSHRHMAALIDELTRKRVQLILVTHHLDEIGPQFTHLMAVKNGQVFYQGPRGPGLNPQKIRRLYAAPSGSAKAAAPTGLLAEGNHFAATDSVCIEMKNVCIRYGGRTVLENLNWTVRRNENWQISGPNGAGKTTLLSLVTADHPQAYANEVVLFGRRRGSGESIWDIKNRIGMISSEFHIRYRKPVPAFDVVLSGFFDSVGLYRSATFEQRRTAERWMQILQIADKSGRMFHTLSQGEQQMVLLGRAMVKSPLLLILDEPCQGLDPPARKHLLELLDWIGHRTDTQLLYVTHHAEERLSCITHEMRFERAGEKGFRVIQQPASREGARQAG